MKQYQDRSYRRLILLGGEDFSLLSSQYTLSAIACQVFRIPAEPFTPRFLYPRERLLVRQLETTHGTLPRIQHGYPHRLIHLGLSSGYWMYYIAYSIPELWCSLYPTARLPFIGAMGRYICIHRDEDAIPHRLVLGF